MAVADIPEIETISQAQRPSFGWRLFVSTMRFLIVLGLGAMTAGGWYLASHGFGQSFRARVVEELHKRGVEASVRRLTLDPFHGLVAQDVRIFDYRDRDKTIAQISRLSLDVNYAALWQRRSFLNAIEVRNAEVTLPLPDNAPPNTVPAQIKHLHAHVYFPPEQIFVSQAEGVFCGIYLSATGQLIKRQDYAPSHEMTRQEWQSHLQTLQRVVAELNQFQFAATPHLQVKFSGDLAAIEEARVEGSFRAEQIRRGQYLAQEVVLAGEYSEQRLNVTQCQWRDQLGQLAATASWRRSDGALQFQVRSGLNLRALLDSFGFGRAFDDFTFQAAPQLDLSGSAHLGDGQPTWQLLGHLTLGAFTYRTIPFTSADADVSWDGTRTLLREVHVRHRSGELTAEFFSAPGDFRVDLNSTIDANALRPLAPADLHEFVDEVDWPHAPVVNLSIRGSSQEASTWSGTGKFQFDRGRFRKVGFNSVTADVRFGQGAATYENFRIVRDEGVATGTLVYDFAHHETRLTNVRGNLKPTEVISWIDPKLFKVVAPYKFDRPPSVTVNGVYQFHGGKNTRLEINVDSPSRMDYVFVGKTLNFDRIAAKLLFTDDRLQILSLDGDTFSGHLSGNADISLARSNQHYHAMMDVSGIDFPRLTDLYFDFKTAKGSMNGHYDWTGIGDDPRTMVGQGEIELRNGNVFAIPIFGPLSDLLNAIIPGFGYRVARKADAHFTLKDGVIHTTDFHVDGGTFGMAGRADLYFLANKLDADVRIDANGLGAVLAPLYKIFEYKGEGPLNHPTWRPKNF